jgi:hypothetical protein
MEDTKLLEDQIVGMKQRLILLRRDKEAFIKAQGMAEEAEKLRAEALKKRDEVALLKTSNAALITKKNAAMAKSLSGMIAKLTKVLPNGKPIVDVKEDGDVFIGWQKEGKQPVSYSSLSGGERVIFDAAMAHALNANIIISEFAEIDDDQLVKALDRFGKMDVQVIGSTCHPPKTVGNPWEVITLK